MPVTIDRLAILVVVLRIHQPHVLPGQFVQRMVGQAQVVNAFHPRMMLREIRRSSCVLRLIRSIFERSVRMSLSVITACMGCKLGPKSRFCRYLMHSEKSVFSCGSSMLVTRFFRAMTAPQTPKPLLVRLLVADCTTMSAPWQIGRNKAGRGDGRIAQQRQIVAMGQVGHGADVEKAQLRIAGQFAIEEAGVAVDLRRPFVEVGRVQDPAALDVALLHEAHRKLLKRAAVALRRGHEVPRLVHVVLHASGTAARPS